MTWTVTVALAAWVGLPVPDEFGPQPPLSPSNILAKMPDSPRRAVGWALGQLVRDEMPIGRVRWLLGEHQPHLKPLPTGGLVGGVHFIWFDYADYGLSVHFVSGQDGVLRVSAVSRNPQ